MASKRIQAVAFVWLLVLAVVSVAQGRDVPNEGGPLAKEQTTPPLRGSTKGSSQINESFSQPTTSLLPNFHLLDDNPNRTVHWATYKAEIGEYYGAQAKISVWGLPNLRGDQQSASQIWVTTGTDGPRESINSVQAGWHVHPELYGDSQTRFFTYWTADGYHKTGCYNLQCRGFVPYGDFAPGGVSTPLSIYDGDQYYYFLRIFKNLETGDWWLYQFFGGDAKILGHWPKSLFGALADHATGIELGGAISYIKGDKGPPMGSGHIPNEMEGKAAAFKRLRYGNSDGAFVDLDNTKLRFYTDKQDCWNVGPIVDKTFTGGDDRYLFYYGGPGGCTD